MLACACSPRAAAAWARSQCVGGAQSPRFQQQVRSESPGPGFYDTDYFYGGLTKPTFNMTIAEDTVAGF